MGKDISFIWCDSDSELNGRSIQLNADDVRMVAFNKHAGRTEIILNPDSEFLLIGSHCEPPVGVKAGNNPIPVEGSMRRALEKMGEKIWTVY